MMNPHDILQQAQNIAAARFAETSETDKMKKELARRYGDHWLDAVIGSTALHSGEIIYTALCLQELVPSGALCIEFIVVEYDGQQFWIHETMSLNSLSDEGESP